MGKSWIKGCKVLSWLRIIQCSVTTPTRKSLMNSCMITSISPLNSFQLLKTGYCSLKTSSQQNFRFHHLSDEAYPMWARPRYLLQTATKCKKKNAKARITMFLRFLLWTHWLLDWKSMIDTENLLAALNFEVPHTLQVPVGITSKRGLRCERRAVPGAGQRS